MKCCFYRMDLFTFDRSVTQLWGFFCLHLLLHKDILIHNFCVLCTLRWIPKYFIKISVKTQEHTNYIRMILQNLIKPIVAGVINISTLGRVGILHISLSWQNGKNLVLSKHFLQIEVLHLIVQLLVSTYLPWCTLTLSIWT